MVTYFVVQSFQRGRKGALIPNAPREARNELHAKRLAERMMSVADGVIAFSRTGSPATGDFEDAVILAEHGDVPEEIFASA